MLKCPQACAMLILLYRQSALGKQQNYSVAFLELPVEQRCE